MAAESLKEGETCSIVLPSTKNDPKVIELDTVLKDWVNETLASERIIVKDLRDDLYDGNGYLKWKYSRAATGIYSIWQSSN